MAAILLAAAWLSVTGCSHADVTHQVPSTLELEDRHGLELEGHGATFRATTKGGTRRSQWRMVGGSHVVFRDMTVRGANPAGGSFGGDHQHQHAWDLLGASGVELDRVRAADLYGDCVYVGQGRDPAKSWSRDLRVHDSTCVGNGRMGVTVVAGRDVRIETTRFEQIARTAFDIEPSGSGFGAQNITFTNNEVTGALPGGFFSEIGDGPVDSVTVSDNRASGVGMYMAVIAPQGQRRSNVTIAANTSDTAYSAPGDAPLNFERVDGLTITGNTIPSAGPDMALATVLESCDVQISGNGFPGAVTEARVAPHSCPTRAPSASRYRTFTIR